ncbi:MAG: sugar transferase [Spirochaetales bacterium]|nr:sugar transferase [Spirochaetales bacterium]
MRGYTNRDSLLNVSIKRIIDLIFSSLALFLIFPVYILVATLIKFEDFGPIFYTSKRVGKNGKEIKFLKFRSMVVEAEKLKEKLLHLNERPNGPLFKMKNDPRVTKIGKILRKYSIDELPQFINVFKGELSLVGPRPHLASEVAHYKDFQYQRMDCIPGITCLAQIKDRNGLSLDDWIRLDLKYRNEWNFKLDFLILAKTVKMIFKGV